MKKHITQVQYYDVFAHQFATPYVTMIIEKLTTPIYDPHANASLQFPARPQPSTAHGNQQNAHQPTPLGLADELIGISDTEDPTNSYFFNIPSISDKVLYGELNH